MWDTKTCARYKYARFSLTVSPGSGGKASISSSVAGVTPNDTAETADPRPLALPVLPFPSSPRSCDTSSTRSTHSPASRAACEARGRKEGRGCYFSSRNKRMEIAGGYLGTRRRERRMSAGGYNETVQGIRHTKNDYFTSFGWGWTPRPPSG